MKCGICAVSLAFFITVCYNIAKMKIFPFDLKEETEMKFSEMPYKRPDLKAMKKEIAGLISRLETADSYEKARAAFLEMDALLRHFETAATLVSIRHSIDTRDAFYDGEQKYFNEKVPELK